MMSPAGLGGLSRLAPLPLPNVAPAGGTGALQGPSFDQLLGQSLSEVNQLGHRAGQQVQQSLLGDDLTMVESFTAIREADLALKLMMQVRNKLVEGYQELQRMQL